MQIEVSTTTDLSEVNEGLLCCLAVDVVQELAQRNESKPGEILAMLTRTLPEELR